MNKLGLTEEQVGDMTLTKFFRLYNMYKMTWDREMVMSHQGQTYSESERTPTIDDIL